MVLNRLMKAFKSPKTRQFADFRFDYNHPVTVTVENNDEEFGAVVFDYTEAGIIVSIPRGKKIGRRMEVFVGQTVSLTVGQRGLAYHCYAKVTKVDDREQELITLAVPEKWEARQDRQFYRLPVELPLRYTPVSNGLSPEAFRSSRTMDLSGGGAKFPVDGPYRRGDLLFVQFDIPAQGESSHIILTAKVRRVEESIQLGTVVAVQFDDISDREQRLLVDWINSRQFVNLP